MPEINFDIHPSKVDTKKVNYFKGGVFRLVKKHTEKELEQKSDLSILKANFSKLFIMLHPRRKTVVFMIQ